MAESIDPYTNVAEDEDYIKVASSEDVDFIEFPKEEDNTIMFSTIQAQFPNATGIKYKGPSGAWRAIRAVDNVLAAPKGGWGNRIYFISALESIKETNDVETRKRKADAADDEDLSKHTKPSIDPLTKDLPVTGLPYKTTTEEMKEYFEKNYGELELCEIKVDRVTGKSRGFGFIRFKNIEHAREAVNNQHLIGGRTVTVKVKQDKPMKLFIGRLPRDVTHEELEKYFSKFGELTDVYLPKPFRNFAFITYASTEDARRVMRGEHELNGSKLNVEERKSDQQRERNTFGNDNRGFGNRQSSSSSRDHTFGNDNRGFGNRQSSSSSTDRSFGGGFNSYSNPRDAQLGNILAPNRNTSSDLKTLLFHYLSRN